jgi:hypothetical protein
MQITLDLPDDLYIEAQAVAKRESRSLASVVLDLIRSARKTVTSTAPDREVTHWELPVVKGARPFTVAEVDQMLEADGLP